VADRPHYDSRDLSPSERRNMEAAQARFEAHGLPSMDEVWSWHQELASMGTRYTGSPGHVRFTDWLQQQFSAVPGFQLHTDRITFQRWLAQDYSLSIAQDPAVGRSGPVAVSYYYPYSGATGAAGVSGRLVDLGNYDPSWYTPAFWARATGGIALVRVPRCTFSLDIGQIPTGGFEPGRTSQETAADYAMHEALVTLPVFQGMFAPVPLLDARNAGVLGVICVWTGLSDDQVANQYNPFITGYPNSDGLAAPGDPGCPALWVGDSTGLWLSGCAASGPANVTLTLTASITSGAATETVWGMLPGSGADHQRSLIVNTHTDGPNVPEENGALGLLALARYFARRQRRHDLYFVMATGHFQLPQFMKTIPTQRFLVGNDATSWWMNHYPAIYQNALAGLSLEHLGCEMWADDANGEYAPTGRYEWCATYTTRKQGSVNPDNLQEQTYLDAVRATNHSGATARPIVTMLPMPIFFGEGAPLYAGGLGTVSMCPLPSYLLQAGSRTQPNLLNLDKLDKRLIYGQILSFARTISVLDAKPATDF
jgi:MYXO-CTERM domain-containing protein